VLSQAVKQNGSKEARYYQQKLNLYRDVAAAELDHGDVKAAADAASRALYNMLDGTSVEFTPSNNGVTVTVKYSGQDKPAQQTQLTLPQFNQFLRGKDGQYDYVIEHSISAVLYQLAVERGMPTQVDGTQQRPQSMQQQQQQQRQQRQQRQPEYVYNDPIPADIRRRAHSLYPFVSQQDQRTQYIIDEMRASADRQQGNSYSIHVK
jgi:hypothetical protein